MEIPLWAYLNVTQVSAQFATQTGKTEWCRRTIRLILSWLKKVSLKFSSSPFHEQHFFQDATTPLSTSFSITAPSTVPTIAATTSGSSSHSVSAGVIAGAVVGGLAGAVVLALAMWLYMHRHRSIGKAKPVDLNGGGVPLSPYTDHLLLSSENTSPTMLPVARQYNVRRVWN